MNKKGIIKYWNMKTKKQKIVLSSITLLLLIGLVSAGWVLFFNGMTGLVISSSVPLTFSTTMTESEIDTTSSGYEKIEYVNLTNSDGDIPVNVTLLETITDAQDSCDNSGDVVFEVEYKGVPIANGESVTITSGATALEITTTAEQYSCPQNASLEVTLNPI